MTNTEIVADLRALANKIEGAPAAPVTPAPAPAPAKPVDNPFIDIPAKYQHEENLGGYVTRYDDPLPEGTPGSVKMLVTGHILSKPQPQYGPDGKLSIGGELIVRYVQRVRFQITANADGTRNEEKAQQILNALGYVMGNSAQLKTSGPTPDSWPFMADEIGNQPIYNGVTKEDAAASIKAWADAQQRMRDEAALAGVAPPTIPASGPVITVEP